MTAAGAHIRTVIERDYDKTDLLPTIDLTDSVWDVKRSGRGDWYEPFMAFSNAWYRGVYRDFKTEKIRNKGNFRESIPILFVEGTHYPPSSFAVHTLALHNHKAFSATPL